MSLSDLLTSLADNARKFETQLDAWNKSLTAQGDEILAKTKEWQKTSERHSEEWTAQFKAYAEGIDGDLKSRWAKLQSDAEAQVEVARKRAEEWRAEAEKKDAETRATWYEAYAANLAAIAQRSEEEASKAIAAAADARAKANASKG